MDVDDKLRQQIIRLCEKQYRKGLQHGAFFYKKDYMQWDDITAFREVGFLENYKEMINPLTGKSMDAVERLTAESRMEDMEELIALLNDMRDL